MATKSSDNRLVEKGDGEQAPSVGAGAEQGAYKKLFQDSSDRSAVDKSALPLAGESPSLTSFELAADDPPQGSDDPELSKPSSYEYERQPGQHIAKAGETLNSVAEKNIREFLGDSYQEIAQDKFNLQAFSQAYRKALAYINKLPENAVLEADQKLNTPGRSPDGTAIYIEEGKVTTWVGNSVTTKSADQTMRTDWDDGSYSISRPDGVHISRDVYGVVSTSRAEAGGWWVTERSDGSSRRANDKTGDFEGVEKDGTVFRKHNGELTFTYPTGVVHVDYDDGRMRDVDANGVRTEFAKDGTSEVFDKEGKRIGSGIGRGMFRLVTTEENGASVSRMQSYSRPDYRFTLSEPVDGSGKLELSMDGKPEKLSFLEGKEFEGLAEPRRVLLEKMNASGMHEVPLTKFKADMIRLENRAKERNLPPEKIAESYIALSAMLGKQDNAPIDEKRRYQLAAETMSNLADPYTISQGFHKTCNVKVLDVVVNAKDPAMAANMISEVALTGKYTLPSGVKVDLPKGALSPVGEAEKIPTLDGQRSFAGQIFDATAINAFLQNKNLFYRYEPMPMQPGMKGYSSGDIMVENSTNKPLLNKESGDVVEYDGLASENIAAVYRLLVGDNAASRDWLLDPRYASDVSDGVKTYSSESEFRDILTQLKKEGAFPFPMHVNTKMAPFWRDSGGGSAGGSSEGAHVVNITDFDPQTGRVEIDNQWSSVNDRNTDDSSVPITQLYFASLGKYQLLTQLSEEVLKKATPGDSNSETLTTLDLFSKVMKGSDPAYLERDYNFLALKFGGIMRQTEVGSPEHVGMMRQFNELRPSAKLTSLKNLIWDGKVSGMDPNTFDRNVLDMAKYFGLIPADLVRGLDRMPQSNDEAKLAGITGGFGDDSVTLSAKVDLIRIFGSLSPTHRDKLIDTFKIEQEKRLAEAREFNRNYAE